MLLEDVEYFLDKPRAKECFEMLDLDKDGKISLQVGPYNPLFAAFAMHVLFASGLLMIRFCCRCFHVSWL